ncbi:hypothetical protein FRC17_008601 [Serendipita sp. 399]|nr:hypothetical protein FRC17_008601 [Serendipita sp. 399]
MSAVQAPALVLVTGGTGFVGSAIIANLLQKGFPVRAAIRSTSKISLFPQYLKDYIDSGKLSFVVIPDMTTPNAFKNAIQGVEGVIHAASPLSPADPLADPKNVLGPPIDMNLRVLEDAATNSTIKRVVVTSSVVTLLEPHEGENISTPRTIGSTVQLRLSRKMGANTSGSLKYIASKVLAEQAAWKWMQERKFSFELVTVWGRDPFSNPDTIRPSASNARILRGLSDAKSGTLQEGYPYITEFTDILDVAEGHVRALVTPPAAGERIALKDGHATWQDILSSIAILTIHASIPGAKGLTSLLLPSLGVQLVASLLLMPLIYLEHMRTIAPSSWLLIYTLVKGLFLSAIMRTYLSIKMLQTYPMVFHSLVISIASHFAYMLIEYIHKPESSLRDEYKHQAKEARSSFLVRSMFLWLLPLLLRGRKSKFQLKDLKEIPETSKAEPSREPLISALGRGKYVFVHSVTEPVSSVVRLDSTSSRYHLLFATLKSFGVTFFAPVVPRMVLLLATFAQPLLIKDMLTFMSDSSAPISRGWAIFGGYLCVYGAAVLSTALYWEKLYAVTVKYRGALVGAIYLKTLNLAAHASRPLGTGMGSNYMSVDVERITIGIEEFHEFWAAMVALPLAFALLYSQAKWVTFIPLGFLVFAFAATSYCAKLAGGKQTEWSKHTDIRLKFLSSTIKQLIPIKFFAYESYIAQRADELRDCEIVYMKKFYRLLMWAAAISNSLMSFTLLLVIGIYAAVFGRTSQALPSILAAYASMKRIQEYLQFDEKERETGVPMEKSGLALKEKTTDGLVHIRGSFSWDKNKDPVLPKVDVRLPTGKLTICAGSVASVGELPPRRELYPVSSPSETYIPSLPNIGYTSQEAFIMPGTIRENILFGAPYDETWYNTVISACALVVDLNRMQSGDGTKLTDGRSLSGGQRQRIALARAVYSRAPLVLLDDPFSALDGETAAQVFTRLLGANGLLRNVSVLLVTHYIHHLPSADHVLIMEKGSIVHSGTWDEVLQSGYVPSDLMMKDDQKPDKGPAVQIEDMTEAAQKEKPGELFRDERDAIDAVDEESQNPYLGGIKPYKYWFGNGGFFYSVFALSVYMLWPTLRLATQGYLKEWSDSATVGNYPAWIGGLAAFAFGALFVAVVGFFFYTDFFVPRIGSAIHKQEIRGLLRASVSWIQSTPSGQIINRFSQDIYEIDFTFPIAFINGASALFGLIGVMVIIYTSSPWLALSAPPMLLAYWFLLRFYLASSKQLQQLEAASKSPLYTVFGTTLSGLDIVRLGMALSSITNMSQMLSQLLMNWALIENGTISVARLQQIAELPRERDVAGKVIISKKTDNWPVHGSVVFDKVELKYGESLPSVLKKVFFTIKPGMKVGICGRTGSGKSSTVQALFRSVDPSLVKGRISIDGVDISTLPLHVIRSSMSIVTQEPFLWHDTIRSNLDVEKKHSDDRIWRALDQVGMKGTIQASAEKLDTIIEESGSFSRGERQLLCLARVLLRSRRIVILDEATSSMDLETDERVRRVVESEMRDSTVLAVAHRISTIVNFDLILVLEDGEIIEADAPRVLLAADGRFAQLARSQGITYESLETREE